MIQWGSLAWLLHSGKGSKKMSYLFIIPARNGSSFKGKNLFECNGKPLIDWTIDPFLKVYQFPTITTDDPWIKEYAFQKKLDVIDRPKELATDSATLDQVLYHVGTLRPSYENYVLLPPTSPLRTWEHIFEAIRQFESTKADSLISVTSELRSIWKFTEYDYARPIVEAKVNRQQMTPSYIANGAIFITSKNVLIKLRRKVGGKVTLYEMSPADSVDIHNEEDIKLAEFYFARRNQCHKEY